MPASFARPSACQSGMSWASAKACSRASVVEPIPRRGRLALRSAKQRDGVERVVDHLQVGDQILDLGALVEARAADYAVADLLAHEHVLEHA